VIERVESRMLRLWGTTGTAMGIRKCEEQNALRKMGLNANS
jgi:hypothetical protein